MKKILFVCYGNICRSPMAEMIMKKLVKDENLENEFYIESAATSKEEIGSDIYSLARQKLIEKGIPLEARRARQLRIDDYDNFDYIVGMEASNISAIKNIVGLDHNNKVLRLLDYTDAPRNISDPWYSGKFEEVYNEIYEGCVSFLDYLKEKEQL